MEKISKGVYAMKKSIISIILASLILSSTALTGCSEKSDVSESNPGNESSSAAESDSSAESAEKTANNYIMDSLGEKNFDGYSFRILPNSDGEKYLFAEEMTGDPLNDALNSTKLYIEDRFNVKLEIIEGVTFDESYEIIAQTAAADDDAFDITIGHDKKTFAAGMNGYLYNIYDIDQFDFDQPWWPENATHALSIAGKLYAVSNYMSYAGLHMTCAMMINKDLAEQYNIEIPYDTVRDGTWTYDKFYTYIDDTYQDLDGDGNISENDIASFTSGRHTWYCMQEAVDIPIYRKDADGYLYMDIDIDKIDTYINWLRKFTDTTHYFSKEEDGMGSEMFGKGNSLFVYCDVGYAYSDYRFTDVKYGFLPTPKFDEYQEDYINCCTDKPWAVPVTADAEQLEIIGYICEAMSCFNYNTVIPAYFEVAMQARVADQPDDAEMLQIIRDTRTIGLAYAYEMNMNNIFGDLGANGNVSSYIARYQKMGAKYLDLFYDKFKDQD